MKTQTQAYCYRRTIDKVVEDIELPGKSTRQYDPLQQLDLERIRLEASGSQASLTLGRTLIIRTKLNQIFEYVKTK
jgi:hypothetical protein